MTSSAQSPLFRVALCPFPISGNPDANWRVIEGLARQAADQGARMAIFPEGAVSGYYGEHWTQLSDTALKKTASCNRALGPLARELGIAIVAGTLVQEKTGLYNSLLAYGPSGRRLARYDKRHLTRRDERFYARGTQPATFRFEGRTIGLLVCFDLRFPLWVHEYARRRPDILVFAFNVCDARGLWKRPVMEAHMRCRAAEANAFVLGVNDARPNPNMAAMALDRGGCMITSRLARRAEVILADLDFSKHYAIEREIVAGHAMDYPAAARWK